MLASQELTQTFAALGDPTRFAILSKLATDGIPAWVSGRVTVGARELTGFEQGAKGVNGGAVRLVGSYAT